MEAPDYIVCLECETPCYVFEWLGDKLREAICERCGNDDPELFARPEEMEDLA